MLVPDNCRVRKMGFSSASHLLRFHDWLWKRLASLIWLSMTLLFLWLWSFDRKLHVPLVRMNHAWFLWFLWNFYILLDAQMKVSDVHWFCVEVGSTLWFWMEPYIIISFDFRRFCFIVCAILCMRFCVCNSSKSRMILVELTFPMYFGWASHTSLVFCWEPNGSTDFVWSLRFPMDLKWNLSLPLDVLHGASLFGFRWNLTY